MSAGIDELIGRLRNNEIGLRYISANEIMSEAADTIERLQLELSRKESTVGTISHALSYAEKECARHRSKAQELENENRRLRLDLDEANEAKRNLCRLLDQALAQLDARQSQG